MSLVPVRIVWVGEGFLLTFVDRWHDDHLGRFAEHLWVHGFREGDDCGLDGAGDAGVGEGAADSPAEFCWEG